ncbi:MAG: hypothetical protein KIH64_003205 [Mycobacterium sp.]|nr:hypothetical protein [Mycobacterium sp.]
MAESRLFIGVSAAELPLRAQALLDPEIPRPADSRFQVRRTHLIWIPLAWLVPLLIVGFSSVRMTITVWSDPAAGAARIIFGSMALVCLILAAISAHRLVLGISERESVKQGRYRQGLHVLGMEGLLIAGRDAHTWVPRSLLPEPTDVTSRSGGGGVKLYAYTLADGTGRVERLACGFPTQSALWLWAEHGSLPEVGWWQ